ncbi:MAG: UDP-N-acetylmuramate--L-alanine ligase [Alphaproteobacteria bacterium]
MSGIAEVLAHRGFTVQGSDIAESANVLRLRDKGIEVHIGHRAENVANAGVVVISSAVKRDNPEVVAAREARVPVIRRADMLAELMRGKYAVAVAGTHGKTTTTSLVAAMLEAGELDPTVINGGVINAYGSNARQGGSEWVVAEADESDGTFLRLPALIGIVTNIDPEHMEHYGSFDVLRRAFDQFIESLPFYGAGVICADHPEVQSLMSRVTDRRLVSYGFQPQADIRGVKVEIGPEGALFDVEISGRLTESGEGEYIDGIHLPMYGRHNVQNALAAIAVGVELGFSAAVIRTALAGFAGVKRRFTRTGEANGVIVIDDYGHHPVEIEAVLQAAREAVGNTGGKVHAVMQPHRYSRLRDLFDDFCTCFNDADTVLIADVFEAGETPIEGYDRDSLVEGIKTHGHRSVQALQSPDDLAAHALAVGQPGDLFVCLGAGSITKWANDLPAQMQARLNATQGVA